MSGEPELPQLVQHPEAIHNKMRTLGNNVPQQSMYICRNSTELPKTSAHEATLLQRCARTHALQVLSGITDMEYANRGRQIPDFPSDRK